MTNTARITRKESNRRLLKLARFLETLPPERFTYCRWSGDGCTARHCGTTGCALGWAVTIPEFQKLDLHFEGAGTPYFQGEFGVGAAQALFDLDKEDAFGLFIPKNTEEDVPPLYVAQKIQDFVIARTVLGC